jgi:hypothetical protein
MMMHTTGVHTFKFGSWRVQIYWPKFTIRLGVRRELYLDLGSNIRLVSDTREGRYLGIGGSALGLGIAVDYWRTEET